MDALYEQIPYVSALIVMVVIFIKYLSTRDAQHAATIEGIVDKHDAREEKGQELQAETNTMLGRVDSSLNRNTEVLQRINGR